MKQQKICFLGSFPDYEYLFFREINHASLDIDFFNPKDITDQISWFPKLPRFFRNKYQKQLIKQHIKQHPQTIFIFTEHRLGLQAILSYLKETTSTPFTSVLLIRNPLSDNHKVNLLLPLLKAHGVNIFTFDKIDAKTYGYDCYPQFASKLSQVSDVPITHDFSFVGRDKGRREMLNNLKNQLENMGYRCNFDIRSIDQPNISYIDYLKVSLSARCMVEILQDNQSGMTLRAIEAILYGRKLLTNNLNIEHEQLYDTADILLYSATLSQHDIHHFMNTPVRYANNRHGIQCYESATVIQSIIESINK